MTDLPFGFSGSDDDKRRDRDKNSGNEGAGGTGGPGGPQNPFGFALGGEGFDPQGFDPSALGQMFSQLGNMFSGMGAGMSNPTSNAGPVNFGRRPPDRRRRPAHARLAAPGRAGRPRPSR